MISNHALGDRRIGWVGRVLAKRLIVVVDLEKDRVAVGVEHTEIMLFVRIVRLAEVVIDGDGLDNSCHGFRSECRDARRYDSVASAEVFPQTVIKSANSIGVLSSW